VLFNKLITSGIHSFSIFHDTLVISCPVENQKAETIAQLMLNFVITQHGVPNRLLSDRGTNFAGKLMAEVYALMGVNRLLTSGYHPQSNGTW
jgi:transposase InsO family protein